MLSHRSSRGHINWRQASDHAAFAAKHIPYLFLGVSDHSRYHTEHDTSDDVDQSSFTGATETALSLLLKLNELPSTHSKN